MAFEYPILDEINLLVEGRISGGEADRQKRTAQEILRRFQTQPGVILADEVGMGKTFVALAVAASVAMQDQQERPVVVMVPPSLREKWPRDFSVFREKCLSRFAKKYFTYVFADKAVDFFKVLDNPEGKRKSIVFLTHGAMSRGLHDRWVKLAIIHRALYKRRDTESLKRALYRVLGRLLGLSWVERDGQDIWEDLLSHSPEDWLRILKRRGIDPEGDRNEETDDDPVPKVIQDVLWELNTDKVYEALQEIPYRESKNFDENLKYARWALSDAIKDLWKICVHSLKLDLPLLILDEAHHLKNARTQLASLFQVPEANADADELSKGPLGAVFERMLFLTATPFQLGHHELCSVLERFEGIDWQSLNAPPAGKESFRGQISQLHNRLNAAQEAAIRLDHNWSRLTRFDMVVNGTAFEKVEHWWQSLKGKEGITPNGQDVLKRFDEANRAMRSAEELLKPWVIRHLKPRKLTAPFDGIERRRRYVGNAILTETMDEKGLIIDDRSLFPFLLAARLTACTPESRPVFAEGLASSYEAFRYTRMLRENDAAKATDFDDKAIELRELNSIGKWYLERLDESISQDPGNHPKISATVKRAIELWKRGEKVLIFCHYVATGRTLRQQISDEIRNTITSIGAEKLKCSPDHVFQELDRIGLRFFDVDSPLRRAIDDVTRTLLQPYPDLTEEALVDVVRRYFRTPSFLVRFFPLEEDKPDETSVFKAFDTVDGSGLTLRRILQSFSDFLVNRCVDEERRAYIDAVKSLQTGSFMGADVTKTYSADEIQGDRSEKLVPNVRLVNGEVRSETRQKLMLTFNTPFFPEILIASAVMAEGVDLHLNCRYIIHHDLCWNPSTLEQRTGRVDRIGAKVERAGKPINIYLPYIAETQDEKMYRVVMDRERWFKVVMGEEYKVDARTAERLAERIALPLAAAEALAFRLEVTNEARKD